MHSFYFHFVLNLLTNIEVRKRKFKSHEEGTQSFYNAFNLLIIRQNDPV